MPARIRLPITVIVALILVTACSGEAARNEQRAPAPTAAGAQVNYEDSFEIQRQFAGLVLPRQSTDVGFELSGELVAVMVDEGQRVTAGQAIARLDTSLLHSERDELNAQQRDLQAQIELNAASMKRATDLKRKGFASDQRIDELQAEERSLQARIERVAAALAANSERLRQSELKAPFAGTVTRRFVDEGVVAVPGEPILRIIEHGSLEARIGIPVRLHDRFAAGDAVQILAAGSVIPGTVMAVSREVTRATLTVPLRIALPGDTAAVPGDQAYLPFAETQQRRGFWVPATALTEGIRGLWNVYAMVPDQGDLYRLEARDVRVLYFDQSRAFVTGAAEEGQWLVSSGTQRFVPGQHVRLDDSRDLVAQEISAGATP